MKTETVRLERNYLPAAGHDWALPLYDPLVKLLGAEAAKKRLVAQATLQGGHRVLDVGCGTGTLAALIKATHPDCEVIGLDPDPKALARGREKAERAGVALRFDQGFADELPYPDASFDRVFSSFMFHHLPAGRREKTLRELRRILTPGGSLHLLDFERPRQANGFLTRLMHSSPHLDDNSEARILALMRNTGFVDSEKVLSGTLLAGLLHIGYFRASVVAASFSPETLGALRQTGLDRARLRLLRQDALTQTSKILDR